MKKKWNLLFWGIGLGLFTPVVAQSYVWEDDIYYSPSDENPIVKQKREEKAKQTAEEIVDPATVSADDSGTFASTFDVDAYNRRYPRVSQQESTVTSDSLLRVVHDTVYIEVAEPIEEGYYLNGFNGTATDYEYATRIRRFHNPKFVVSVGDPAYTDIYFLDSNDWNVYIEGNYAWVTPTWTNDWYWNYMWAPYSYTSLSWRWGYWGWNSWHYDPWYGGWGYPYYGYYPYHYHHHHHHGWHRPSFADYNPNGRPTRPGGNYVSGGSNGNRPGNVSRPQGSSSRVVGAHSSSGSRVSSGHVSGTRQQGNNSSVSRQSGYSDSRTSRSTTTINRSSQQSSSSGSSYNRGSSNSSRSNRNSSGYSSGSSSSGRGSSYNNSSSSRNNGSYNSSRSSSSSRNNSSSYRSSSSSSSRPSGSYSGGGSSSSRSRGGRR